MGGVKPLKGDKSNKTGSIEDWTEINNCCIMNLADHTKITKYLSLLRMSYGGSL
jgi:hypothetical protein